jgi:hypothetical protein
MPVNNPDAAAEVQTPFRIPYKETHPLLPTIPFTMDL